MSTQYAHKLARLPALRTILLYLPPPRKYSWYSLLLEAESTPGPQCGRKGDANKKIPMMYSGNRTRDLPACSAVPVPSALSRNTYVGVEIRAAELHRSGCSVSQHDDFPPVDEKSFTRFSARCVGPTAGLYASEERNIFSPCRESTLF